MTPLRIFMADPTHDTILPVSDTIPINIGFVGSYAKKLFGDDIEISLFKYPQTVIEAIRERPPDILALSNYAWNSFLSKRLAELGKEANPDVLTIQGGANFPSAREQQLSFLSSRSKTDVYIELEGEAAFSNFISRVLGERDGGPGVFEAPIDGCLFIEPSTRGTDDPVLVKGELPARIHDLDDIPSPYLDGMMDKFFDGRLTPFIETNRGCPFKCTFCHTGRDYYRKTHMFSAERIKDEIGYIAKKLSNSSVTNLHIADTNFGMYRRDRETSLALSETRKKYGWPMHIIGTTGKNSNRRVIEVSEILGSSFYVTMSVQSMDEGVLSNIRRSNIRMEDYRRINDHLRKANLSTLSEMILGLPGESRESFLKGVAEIVDSGVSQTTIYTLMLLDGTEFKNPDYRERYGIKSKFRIVPLNFGEYGGKRVFDFEEVGIETNTLSFEDYLAMRCFSLIVATLHSSGIFEELVRFALSLGISRSQILLRAFDEMDRAPRGVRETIASFMEETRSELWDDPDRLVSHYREKKNYQRLLRGDVGGNLIHKYKARSMAFETDGWIAYLSEILLDLARQVLGDDIEEAERQIDTLARFCRYKLNGIVSESFTEVLSLESPYDIVGWLKEANDTPLDGFGLLETRQYTFTFSDEQKRSRKDLFKRYGTDLNGLSKIFTRVNSLEVLFRNVDIAGATRWH